MSAKSMPAYQDGYRAAERAYKARERELLGQMVLIQREVHQLQEHLTALSTMLNNTIQESGNG